MDVKMRKIAANAVTMVNTRKNRPPLENGDGKNRRE